MSVENSFLRKLIETKEWETVLNKDITADYFSGANKRAFKWLSDFKVKYGELPDKETFAVSSGDHPFHALHRTQIGSIAERRTGKEGAETCAGLWDLCAPCSSGLSEVLQFFRRKSE